MIEYQHVLLLLQLQLIEELCEVVGTNKWEDIAYNNKTITL